jgi:hypothetical protein
MAEQKVLRGRVTEFDGMYYRVDCPEAPPAFRVQYLVHWQLQFARVGDKVQLEYRACQTHGSWVVTEVLSGPQA